MNEVHERTKCCDFPALVTTATDGDNGGWFRNTSSKGNFWGVFYQPLLEKARNRETEIQPVFIEDYLAQHGANGEVRVKTAAWNTGWHHGTGFVQWTGSQAQQDALTRLTETSSAFHALQRSSLESGAGSLERQQRLAEAHWRLLRAETSCNFFWGEAWVARCHQDMDEVWQILNSLRAS